MGITFAQKYRPILFFDVLDQEGIIKVLKSLLKTRKFSMPFMFSGVFGSGKTSLARIYARAILCTNLTPNHEPCNECESCISFLNGNNPAYIEIDAASNGSVEDIRRLRDEGHFRTLGGSEIRVLVIDECHSISKMGNEALLKQLEDGIDTQVYIFCTTSPESMHEAVRSRCFEFNLNPVSKKAISERLKYICNQEKISYSEKALDSIASVTAPHVRDAIKNLEYLSNYEAVTDEVVLDYFKIYSQLDYLRIILNLKDNLPESLSLFKKVSLNINISEIYQGIISCLLKVSKLNYSINDFNNEEELSLGKEISTRYKDDISKIISNFLLRNKNSDALTLESDLIILHNKLNGAELSFKEVVNETSIKKVEVVEKIKKEELQKNKIEKIENTTEVLKRYKSYSEPLAMMMERSKNSNSLKSKTTVESNKNVKDLKQNVSKSEIKNFIESKRSS